MLIIRLLVVAALAFAFDRPVVATRESNAGAAGRDVVILLDCSASMRRVEGGRSLFERARDRTVRLIQSMEGPSVKVGVVLLDASPAPVLPELTHNLPALIAKVQSVSPTNDRGDAAAAIIVAESLFADDADTGRSRTMIAMTDLQKSQWEGALSGKINIPLELRDMTRNGPANPHSSSTDLATPEQPLRLALLTRDAKNPEKSVFYLAAAVQAVAGRPPELVAPDEITNGSFDLYDVVIIASAGKLNRRNLASLHNAVLQGAALIWVIDSDGAIGSLLRASGEEWAPAAPVAMRMSQRDIRKLDPSTVEQFFSGSLGGAYEGVMALYQNAAFSDVASMKIHRDGEALLSFSDGAPFVAEAPVGLGRVFTVHANLAPSGGDFAKSAAFPLLVSVLLDRASPARGSAQRDEIESDRTKLSKQSSTGSGDYSSQRVQPLGAEFPLELWPWLIGVALILVMVDLLVGADDRRGVRPLEGSR